MSHRRAHRALLGVVGIAALAAGCASAPAAGPSTPTGAAGAANAADAGSGELFPITVAGSRLVSVAPIVLGLEHDVFAKHGLDVTLDLDTADLAGIPSLVAGRVEITNAETVTLLAAASEGHPVQLILPSAASTGVKGDDYGALLVAGDSPIQSPKELEGKVVSANSLSNIAALAVREAVRADGGDPTAIELVEVAFPDVPTALANGTISAAWVVEPFKAAAEAGGARAIGWGFEDIAPEVTVSSWITTTTFAAEHPDIVAAFKAAVQESYAYARDHPDETKQTFPEVTSISAEVANTVRLTSWKDEVSPEELELVLAAAQDFGLVTKPVDLQALVFKE
jgi:NitT/TauT family transport system substrate-binding protein